MKLLFVHDRLGAHAGAEANLWHTAATLAERGHSVGLLHGPCTGRGEEKWNALFQQRFALDPTDTATGTTRALAEFQPDLVYLHNLPGSAVAKTLVRAGVPLVRMVHDHQTYCLRSCKYHYFDRQICTRALSPYCIFPCGGFLARDRSGGLPFRWVSYHERRRELDLHHHFHRLIVASDYMKAELVRNGIAPARIEIHAPVPPSDPTSGTSVASPSVRIMYTGQIVRGKGVDVLLEALALVRLPFECLIIGDGHHRHYCEQLSRRLGLADRVHFPGFLPQDRLREFYPTCRLAVMSSLWPEPFGAAGLEAMRHGLPIVAFDAGAIKEWLHDGENGFLVPWMDREVFAARVEDLLRDYPLARRLGETARARAAGRYDFSNYISGLERTFAQVVAEQSPVPVTS